MSDASTEQPPSDPGDRGHSHDSHVSESSVHAESPRLCPNHWDLYILVAAVAVGLLLSPWLLGRFAPGKYDQLFVGGQEESAKLDEFLAQTKNIVETLIATGVTEAAVNEQLASTRDEKEKLEQAVAAAHANRTASLHIALFAALALLLAAMLVETVLDDEVSNASLAPRRILARLRYVAAAVAIILVLARMDLLWPS